MTNDKLTTYTATAKVIIGMLGAILIFLGKPFGEEISDALLALATSSYLVFSWLQGFWTNKELNKPISGGTVTDNKKDDTPVWNSEMGTNTKDIDTGEVMKNVPINRDAVRINLGAEEARKMEGREFLDPSDIALQSLIGRQF